MSTEKYTCGKCGARVGNSKTHARWHDQLNDRSGADPEAAVSGDSASSESVESTLTELVIGCFDRCAAFVKPVRVPHDGQVDLVCPNCATTLGHDRLLSDASDSASALTPRQVGALALLREYAETQPCDCIEDGTYTTSECSRCRVLRQAEAADKAPSESVRSVAAAHGMDAPVRDNEDLPLPRSDDERSETPGGQR